MKLYYNKKEFLREIKHIRDTFFFGNVYVTYTCIDDLYKNMDVSFICL